MTSDTKSSCERWLDHDKLRSLSRAQYLRSQSQSFRWQMYLFKSAHHFHTMLNRQHAGRNAFDIKILPPRRPNHSAHSRFESNPSMMSSHKFISVCLAGVLQAKRQNSPKLKHFAGMSCCRWTHWLTSHILARLFVQLAAQFLRSPAHILAGGQMYGQS